MYLPRDSRHRLQEALDDMPVVVLTGARQVGKTTLLLRDSGFEGRRYVSLDEFPQREAAQRDPEALLAGPEPLTVDEVQRVPQLLEVIKAAVDRDRTPGRFLLSGSANLALLAGVSETLAGRAVHVELQPLSRREARGETDERPFLARLFDAPFVPPPSDGQVAPEEVLAGGMPAVRLGQIRRPATWFEGYEQTYLERDIRSLAHVADLPGFRHLLHLVALRTGQILNLSDLSRDVHLSYATVRRYLGLMEASCVVTRLPSFRGSRTTRLVKSPKLHVFDSGVAAWLAGVTSLDPAAEEPMRGALYETWVAQNLRSVLGAWIPGARLHYWHVQGRHEVDFVVEAGRRSIGIEVKAAARWTARDLRGLRAFSERTPSCVAAILAYNGVDAVSLGDRLYAVPLATLGA